MLARTLPFLLLATTSILAADPPNAVAADFKAEEIATDLTIGYAVITADVNGDKKPDIVVVDQKRVVWYENPSWKPHTIIKGLTKPDNVCICALDIDKDGQLDFVLGADWKPFDTKQGRHPPMAQARQDVRRGMERPPHRRRADRPPDQDRLDRRQDAERLRVSPAHGRQLDGGGQLGRRPARARVVIPRADRPARRPVGAESHF